MLITEQIRLHPEWSIRTHVEAWLTSLTREAGEWRENILAEFGARLGEDGQASVRHLTNSEVTAIMARAKELE